MSSASLWIHRSMPPTEADIYLVRVPYIPSGIAYALWDGLRWMCWGTSPDRAEMAAIRGPEDGYDWQPVDWTQIV